MTTERYNFLPNTQRAMLKNNIHNAKYIGNISIDVLLEYEGAFALVADYLSVEEICEFIKRARLGEKIIYRCDVDQDKAIKVIDSIGVLLTPACHFNEIDIVVAKHWLANKRQYLSNVSITSKELCEFVIDKSDKHYASYCEPSGDLVLRFIEKFGFLPNFRWRCSAIPPQDADKIAEIWKESYQKIVPKHDIKSFLGPYLTLADKIKHDLAEINDYSIEELLSRGMYKSAIVHKHFFSKMDDVVTAAPWLLPYACKKGYVPREDQIDNSVNAIINNNDINENDVSCQAYTNRLTDEQLIKLILSNKLSDYFITSRKLSDEMLEKLVKARPSIIRRMSRPKMKLKMIAVGECHELINDFTDIQIAKIVKSKPAVAYAVRNITPEIAKVIAQNDKIELKRRTLVEIVEK